MCRRTLPLRETPSSWQQPPSVLKFFSLPCPCLLTSRADVPRCSGWGGSSNGGGDGGGAGGLRAAKEHAHRHRQGPHTDKLSKLRPGLPQVRFDDWDDQNLLMIVGESRSWGASTWQRLHVATESLWLL